MQEKINQLAVQKPDKCNEKWIPVRHINTCETDINAERHDFVRSSFRFTTCCLSLTTWQGTQHTTYRLCINVNEPASTSNYVAFSNLKKVLSELQASQSTKQGIYRGILHTNITPIYVICGLSTIMRSSVSIIFMSVRRGPHFAYTDESNE